MSPAYHLSATLLPDGDGPADLWIADGRLTFTPVDGAGELAPPGGFVLPGLVDCHAHISIDYAEKGLPWDSDELIESNLRDQLASGALLLRDPGSPAGSSLAWQNRPGLPRVQAAPRMIAPQGRYLDFAEWASAGELEGTVLRHLGMGAPWVKVIADWPRYDKASGGFIHIPNYDAATLGAAVRAVHDAGGRMAVHVVGHEGTAIAIEAGVDTIEHGEFLDDDLLAQCAAKGIAWTPTVAMAMALAVRMERTDETRRRFADERDEQYRALLPAAARLGVTVLAGTDLIPHGSIAKEIAALARAGLPPKLALAAGSTGARAFLGEPGIEEGARADLVLYAADPRNDPGVLERPALIMLDGMIVSRASQG